MKKINKNNTTPLTPLVRGEQNSNFPLIRGNKGVSQNKKAFTLVELIIVITILAILATIAFVSFENYSKSARDAIRVATLKSIEKWLSLIEIKTWKYPTPDEYITISSWITIYINQWIVWQLISSEVKLNKEPKDPKDNTNYLYSTNWNNTKYQLWAYLEEDNKTLLSLTPLTPLVKGEQDSNFPLIRGIEGVFIPHTYASSIDYTNRYFYTIWDKVWIFLSGATNKPLLLTESFTWVDLSKGYEYKIYFSNNTTSWSITWSWSDLLDEIVKNQGSSWTSSNNEPQIESCNWKSIWQACAWWIYAWSSGRITYITTPTYSWWTDSLLKRWNYWNVNNTTTSITSTTDWEWNTAALATTIDADSSTSLFEPHLAAQYCYDMVYWWYDDWFLPAKDELNLLYTNSGSIWGFVTYRYWSSTESNNSNAWYQDFSDGYQDDYDGSKNYDYAVRCIRKF